MHKSVFFMNSLVQAIQMLSKIALSFLQRQKERDYVNISAVHAANPPNPDDSDSDTSDDEVEVSYTHVICNSKPGCQNTSADSSTSEDELQYSHVKV